MTNYKEEYFESKDGVDIWVLFIDDKCVLAQSIYPENVAVYYIDSNAILSTKAVA